MAVYGCAGHAQRHAGGQPGGAGDVARQRAYGVHAAKYHIVIVGWRNVVALDQRFDDMGTQIGAMHMGQRAPAFTGGRAQGINNIGLGHKYFA